MSSNRKQEIVQHALDYGALGWPVFPMACPGKSGCTCLTPDCASPGKHPLIADWPAAASCQEEDIRGFFETDLRNIGLNCGPPDSSLSTSTRAAGAKPGVKRGPKNTARSGWTQSPLEPGAGAFTFSIRHRPTSRYATRVANSLLGSTSSRSVAR